MLTEPRLLNVSVGTRFFYQVVAIDKNHDSITYSFAVKPNSPSMLLQNGVFSWQVRDPTHVTVEFIAKDPSGLASILRPTILLCHCLNNGSCNYKSYEDLIENSFNLVHCACQPGWTGAHCQVDIDGCADGPCFEEVNCTDVPANQVAELRTEYKCGPCPKGLLGKGDSCYGEYSIFSYCLFCCCFVALLLCCCCCLPFAFCLCLSLFLCSVFVLFVPYFLLMFIRGMMDF